MKILLIVVLCFVSFTVPAQFITKYPDIPRIDVHVHINNNYTGIKNYLVLREKMLNDTKIDLAMLINLGGEKSIDTIREVSNGRIMTCISDYRPFRGLTHKPEDMAASLERGYAGYKIWYGPYSRGLKKGEEGFKYFDDPVHEPVLSAMERTGLPGASIHIADPNGPFWDRGNWAADPVEYWRQIMGLERVLNRHPNLVIVAAHGAWLVAQDAQIDFLRYLLSAYPNFYVDLAATFQYFYLVNNENLRDFIIEYSDRILYGTDISSIKDEAEIPEYIERYSRTFRMLETDEMVEGGFFSMNPAKGLNLPKDVLEKIYFRNALKIYPGLKDQAGNLGYRAGAVN